MSRVRLDLKIEEEAKKSLEAFAEKHNLNAREAVEKLFLLLPQLEPLIFPQTTQTTEATRAITSPKLLSPISKTEGSNVQTLDSPNIGAGASDPLPLENSPTASQIISKNSQNGSSTTLKTNSDEPQLPPSLAQRLLYQQEKAKIWIQARITAERGIQATREQVKRFHEDETGRRAKVIWEPETGEPDNGRPDFYD